MKEWAEIGAAVRRFRRRVDLSQVVLAQLWGVSQAQISEIESGAAELRLSPRQVQALAKHVNLPAETVLYEMGWPIQNVSVTLGQVIDQQTRREQDARYNPDDETVADASQAPHLPRPHHSAERNKRGVYRQAVPA